MPKHQYPPVPCLLSPRSGMSPARTRSPRQRCARCTAPPGDRSALSLAGRSPGKHLRRQPHACGSRRPSCSPLRPERGSKPAFRCRTSRDRRLHRDGQSLRRRCCRHPCPVGVGVGIEFSTGGGRFLLGLRGRWKLAVGFLPPPLFLPLPLPLPLPPRGQQFAGLLLAPCR